MVALRHGVLRGLVVGAVVLLVATHDAPTQAQDAGSGALPPGFTDGVAVGGEQGPEDPVEAGLDAQGSGETRAVTTRYFGVGPWRAIEASAAAATRSCSVSNQGIVALAVAPVFKESSTATSAATAPAPMTLSRYDEWSGTFGTGTNRDANHGLYAFRDPSTAYKRAFWHPGIGIWQYDSVGVGAPFTAAERMDVSHVSGDVVRGMTTRYCNPSASVIGHSAPFTDLERRYSAWTPWGYPCTSCEQEFQAMTGTTPDFQNISLVEGISAQGGVQARTCTLSGQAGTTPCWYVDPSVGVIEGSTSWARINPLDGGSPSTSPTPLALPFYVIDRGTTEERHWLRSDTGYGIDIAGSRQIGKNARPRSNQAGSGVTWRSGSGLCDLTTGHGACVPPPPPGLTSTPLTVNGTYRPVALDVEGDGRGDVLWYAPGATTDYVWSGNGSGGFTATPISIGGTYDDVLPLDLDADGDDDLLWYNRSTGRSYLWLRSGAGSGSWSSIPLARPKGLRPLVVDTDGDGRAEVFWYGPGSLPDALWAWNGSAFTTRTQAVGGRYQALTGDFDGNGKDDLLWYAAGRAADYLWLSTGAGTHRDVAISINGTYQPLLGDFDGDRNDDVFWYGPGRTADNVWFGGPGGTFARQTVSVSGTYQPAVADLGGDGRDDVVWYAPGSASDAWWRWGADRMIASAPLEADGRHQAVVGAFSTGGADGIVWYEPGPTPDTVWWR